MTKTVIVTEAHINRGFRRSYNKCPIALAFNDSGITNRPCRVGLRCIYVDFPTGGRQVGLEGFYEIQMPPVAQQFVQSFDGNGTVSPFSFEVIYQDQEPTKLTA
ncbi:MAG: hypothetical protein OXI53_08890 [Nitrospira sp.]|nr:hypothetical protein [Nitrospira sp.]MDE0405412.1 hypothetical protein [Nitrospira sp.]MDE0504606.1 hypothetical protein [Candidatus Poribacteria bacterium]